MKKPVFWSFLICFSYWVYLFLTTQVLISCDAIAYESTGRLLQEKGWLEFFKTGPHREPLYPFLISIAMRIGSYIHVSYQPVIVIIQLLMLLTTQLLTLRVLRILKINNFISALVILYLGISPAIVNSALSLFSEIATYPFILSIVLISYYSWLSFNKSKKLTSTLAIVSGILFGLMALNKAIFEIITPGFIVLVFLLSLLTRKRKFIFNSLIYFLITATVFLFSISAYKLTNKIFNGNFVITQRGDLKLYGTAVRRTEPLTKEYFLTALAYIPGEGFCRNIFGEEKCSYWSFEQIDDIGFNKLAQLKNSGLRPEKISGITIQLAIKQALQSPFQYSLFYLMEGMRMLFWESTKIGFVSYPKTLEKIFNYKPFKNGIRIVMYLLTSLALLYSIIFLWQRKKVILAVDEPKQENTAILLFLNIFIILLFIGAYSLFNTVTRYALPIAPLYLITIAFFLQRIISSKNT